METAVAIYRPWEQCWWTAKTDPASRRSCRMIAPMTTAVSISTAIPLHGCE